jgi:hypothetical protein
MTLDDEIEKTGKEQPFVESSELADAMKTLDTDTTDKSLFSSIDFNARLTSFEINSIMIIDEFQRLGILPSEAALTRNKKRLSVSLQGLGRTEKVQIAQGQREHQSGSGIGDRMRNLFTRQ